MNDSPIWNFLDIAIRVSVPLAVVTLVGIVKIVWDLNNRMTALEKVAITHVDARKDRHELYTRISETYAELKLEMEKDTTELKELLREVQRELHEHVVRHKKGTGP